MKNMYGIAIALVAEAFKDRVDKQGEPYFLHCMTVANDVPEEDRIPAILHDYVEDIFPDDYEAGFAHLRELGFNETDVSTVDVLTHRRDEEYLSVYIKRIALHPRATRIKRSDLRHNSQITRIKGALTAAHFNNVQKYHTAYQYLSKT